MPPGGPTLFSNETLSALDAAHRKLRAAVEPAHAYRAASIELTRPATSIVFAKSTAVVVVAAIVVLGLLLAGR
jgi:hypothetical protein